MSIGTVVSKSSKILVSKRNPFSLLINRNATTTTRRSCAVKMVTAIRVHEYGGPEVLKWEDVELGEPKDGEIRVKNKAIGLNFIDVYFRKGEYKVSEMPFIPGVAAAGVVTAVGPGVICSKLGDYVAYAGSPMGAYAEELILPAEKVFPVPTYMDPTVITSVLFEAMTVYYLLPRYDIFKPERTVLIHDATSGIGSLLCQWANAHDANVIGTVSIKEKVAQAKDNGCHHVIAFEEEDFVKRVLEITKRQCGGLYGGVDIVYDSVGKDTFKGSLACLKLRGYMVSLGQSSGAPDSESLSVFTANSADSVYLATPNLIQYPSTRIELLDAARDVFENVTSGKLKVSVNHTYHLSQAAQAHADLEAGKTSGSVVLIP